MEIKNCLHQHGILCAFIACICNTNTKKQGIMQKKEKSIHKKQINYAFTNQKGLQIETNILFVEVKSSIENNLYSKRNFIHQPTKTKKGKKRKEENAISGMENTVKGSE